MGSPKSKFKWVSASAHVWEEALLKRSRTFAYLSATTLAVLLVMALVHFPFFGVQGFLFDLLTRTKPTPTPVPEIVLVAYDDASSARYNGSNKIPAAEIAEVVLKIAEAKPLALALMAPINEKIYSQGELESIAASLSQIDNAFIGYTDDESLGQNPAPALQKTAKYLPGFVSRDSFSYGADSVTRRVMVSIEGIPTVYSKIDALYRETKDLPENRNTDAYERFSNAIQTYIHWQGPAGTYPMVSTVNTIEGKVARDKFAGKIVLIGSALNSKKGADHIFTPFSREHFQTTFLEGAANSLGTLIQGNGISKTSGLLNTLLALLIAVFTVNCVLSLSPGKGITLVVVELLLLVGAAWALLFYKNTWLDITHSLLIACLGYYLVIPFRLLDEYRKRWHYQEKSELMGQLERLKSNFLSLISHDLKTPIARIQGNAELALNESGAPMTPKQRQSLDAIINTTEDLSRYVETVLDLTRVESAKVPLNKTSKDINLVVKDVVERHRYLADEKNIEVQLQLEPLFSFKFDTKLIEQVITNLVLNAIKYSDPNTTVSIQSVEDGSGVQISVADQGIGIPPEEQGKVFEKFYRGKTDASQKEKGTGLGLYLVKYFVELHKGTVSLSSELGKGSTFKIFIPV